LSPAPTAFTRARLSFFVRPFTDGTVTGGSFAAESFPTVEAVLEEAPDVKGVDEAATAFSWVVPLPIAEPTGISSIPGAGRASLLAAHASEVARTKEMSMVTEKYLFD
jgi:hypothetical protein